MLCDTGPLVALIDRDDPHHSACARALATMPPVPLVTTWPCWTEAMYLANRARGYEGQNALWQFVAQGFVTIYLPTGEEWLAMQALMNQYRDMPLDLADASLLTAALNMDDWNLFSIDSRLRAVQSPSGQWLELAP